MCVFMTLILLAWKSDDQAIRGICSYAFGKQYTFAVTKAQLLKSPAWKDGNNPPLSARKAIELATKLREKLVKDDDQYQWSFKEAALHKMAWDRWTWEVLFEARVKEGGSTGIPPYLNIMILMDGTVVEPTIKEMKDK